MFAALHRVRQLPGVRAAALTTMLPYGNLTNARRVMRLDEAAVAKTDPNAPEPGVSGLFTAVTPGWFATIGVRFLRGRDFTDSEWENKNSTRVSIIDETMAKKLFPKGDALGQHLGTRSPRATVRLTTSRSSGSSASIGMRCSTTISRAAFLPRSRRPTAERYLQVRMARDDAARVGAMIPTVRRHCERWIRSSQFCGSSRSATSSRRTSVCGRCVSVRCFSASSAGSRCSLRPSECMA